MAVCLTACSPGPLVAPSESSATLAIDSAIPADRLAKIKPLLPKVAYPRLQAILESPDTFWYDHESLKPSYQAAVKNGLTQPGANSNDRWFNLLASGAPERIGTRFYDRAKKRFRFPFGATAGTDDSPNLKVVNFLWLPPHPSGDGSRLPLVTYPTDVPIPNNGNLALASWGWRYPIGAVLGELLLVAGEGAEYWPMELRTRTRQAKGWATNAFRPFPTAAALSEAIKKHRASWQSDARLSALVAHLENPQTLTPKTLRNPDLPRSFDITGAVDSLPDFGDPKLVKELLTGTTFVSAYGRAWKSQSNLTAFAPSTTHPLSIVPQNYEAGVLAVSEDSCMRCHQDTGKGLTAFNPGEFGGIVLYGEMWGRDGIFSFHPFDESQYTDFKVVGRPDNRRHAPKLLSQGLVATYDPAKHKAEDYPRAEVGMGQGNTP